MFVQTNSVLAIKKYFKDRLKDKFSDNEIKHITRESVISRLKIDETTYILGDHELLSESDLLYFRNIVKRLLNNEPFQHIIGKTLFFGLELLTDSRALIPRPETEELVDWILQDNQAKKQISVLDLCSGSGCIALALKSFQKEWGLYGIDISKDAINLAKENEVKTGLNVTWIEYDLIENSNELPFELNAFDIWVSNPPYIPYADKSVMAENVLNFEPHIALFVQDEDPLIFYTIISELAKMYLKQGGTLYFEIHENLAEKVELLLITKGYKHIQIKNDLQGKNRMIRAEKP